MLEFLDKLDDQTVTLLKRLVVSHFSTAKKSKPELRKQALALVEKTTKEQASTDSSDAD